MAHPSLTKTFLQAAATMTRPGAGCWLKRYTESRTYRTCIYTYRESSSQLASVGLARARPNKHVDNFPFSPQVWSSLRLAPIMFDTCKFRIYSSCCICAQCNISILHVGLCNHCCSRDKTSRTERLNSGNQRTGA